MPKLVEVKINYGVGVKVNIGNYENADAHISESETWTVADLDTAAIQEFVETRYLALRDKLGTRIEAEYTEINGGK